MHIKYWIGWLFTLLIKFAFAAATVIISLSIFQQGINQGNIIGVVLGIAMSVIALMLIISFVKAAIIPWRGMEEEYIPIYTREWESYETYKNKIEKKREPDQ